MKKLFTVLCLCISICSVAQSDTADLRAGATDMVFYNASTGTKTNASNLDWHLAFGVRSAIPPYKTNQAAAIRINEAIGVELYKSPSQKVSGWNSFDTTGWRGWQRMHNPDTTWTIGALNINKDFGNDYNYGWGAYSFGSHSVIGDSSVYLLKMPDGSFRKLAILNLQYDTAFNFLYDKLDNSDYTAAQVRKRLFGNKMFAYYSLDTKTAMDKEPAISDWDMVFTRYNNTTYDPGNLSQDMGILTNDSRITGTEVSSTATQPCYNGAFSTYINAIGKSWMQSTTPDSLTYYVADATTSQTAFKFVVNYFGGSYTGKMAFTTTASACATGIAELNTSEVLTLYPVPAVNALHVHLTSESSYNTEVIVTDIAGRTLLTKDYQVTAGQNDIEMNTSALSAGNYIIAINTTAGKVSRMISVTR